MQRLQFNTIGGSGPHAHRHLLRSVMAVAAVIAGGLAVFGLSYALIAGIAPAESLLLWAGIALCGLLCLAGVWVRSDSPDARNRYYERERRGY